MDYAGKWVLVTGAGERGRIGSKIVAHFAARGANIYLHHLDQPEEALHIKDEVMKIATRGARVEIIHADLSKRTEVELMFSRSEPDIVINNAGIFRPAMAVEGMSLADYLAAHEAALDAALSANIKTAFLVTEAAIHTFKRRRRGGVVVFEGDAFIAGGGAYPTNLAAYTASKAFISYVVKQFAGQHGRAGIRFLGVLNGTIEPPKSAPMDTVNRIMREIPLPAAMLNPWLGGERVAEAIDHLIQMDAVNGTCLEVDGGRKWNTEKEF